MRVAKVAAAVAVLFVLVAVAQAQGWQFSQPSWTLDDFGWTGNGGAGPIPGGNGVYCHAYVGTVGSGQSVATATCHGTINVTKGPCAPPSINTIGSAFGNFYWHHHIEVTTDLFSCVTADAKSEHESTIVAPGTEGTRHVEHHETLHVEADPGEYYDETDDNPNWPWQVTALSTFTESGNVKVYLYVRAEAKVVKQGAGVSCTEVEAGTSGSPVKNVCGQFQVQPN